jgi:hypothetical protein
MDSNMTRNIVLSQTNLTRNTLRSQTNLTRKYSDNRNLGRMDATRTHVTTMQGSKRGVQLWMHHSLGYVSSCVCLCVRMYLACVYIMHIYLGIKACNYGCTTLWGTCNHVCVCVCVCIWHVCILCTYIGVQLWMHHSLGACPDVYMSTYVLGMCICVHIYLGIIKQKRRVSMNALLFGWCVCVCTCILVWVCEIRLNICQHAYTINANTTTTDAAAIRVAYSFSGH